MRRREALSALGLAACAKPWASLHASPEEGPLVDVLRSAGPVARRVLQNAGAFELQIIWSRLRADARAGWRVHQRHEFGVDARRWFAAASFIKLPLAAMIGELLTQAGLSAQLPALRLTLARAGACAPLPEVLEAGWPLLRLLRAMLVVSDNRAYNALYELIGSDGLHRRLAELGYRDSRLGARLGCASASPGKLAAQLLDATGQLQFDSPAMVSERSQRFPHGRALKGAAWMQDGLQIPGPHDFSRSNFMPLADVHRMTLELGSGSRVDEQAGFALDSSMRSQLADCMRMLPRQCPDPIYPAARFPDDYSKWLMPMASRGRLPDSLSIASKNAESYGFIGDSAFVVDAENGIAFALSAVLFVDRDGVLNDGRYAYAEIGRPFLRELGSAVLNYERAQPQ